MKRSILLVLSLTLAFSAPLAAAKKPRAKSRHKPAATHAHRQVPSASAGQAFETDLLDWSKVPFSDWRSHGVLVRQPQGLAAWRLRSSFAFGSQAALPHPAKDLFDLRLEWKVEGESGSRFATVKPELKSYARWAQESAVDGDQGGCFISDGSAEVEVVHVRPTQAEAPAGGADDDPRLADRNRAAEVGLGSARRFAQLGGL